ncbi:hypothetical protein AAVH_10998 [Aphelenchoides avenae]|nr:hypothetical protein AAVH_10998 [Aphelenchus avenae]
MNSAVPPQRHASDLLGDGHHREARAGADATGGAMPGPHIRWDSLSGPLVVALQRKDHAAEANDPSASFASVDDDAAVVKHGEFVKERYQDRIAEGNV